MSNLCNFQLLASDIEEHISRQKLRNCRVAKTLISHTFFVKFRVLKKENFSENIRYVGLKFSAITEISCSAFNIYWFILFALSDNDKHMLMRQKL